MSKQKVQPKKKHSKRAVVKNKKISLVVKGHDNLFAKVVAIIERAHSNVVRAVDQQMVIAYWLIGREIVQEIQDGEARAAYGKQVIENLSKKLTEKYGKGYSETSLQYFRKFYQTYFDKTPIPRPSGVNSDSSFKPEKIPRPMGVKLPKSQKLQLIVDEYKSVLSPQLSWSHYRALMRVTKEEAREFFELEAISCNWDKRTLARQIYSYYYERMLKSQRQALPIGHQLGGQLQAESNLMKIPWQTMYKYQRNKVGKK
mgnify:CR=1 FL=1